MFSTLQERGRSQEGFTLIELLVVILIIGILAAIAIPNFLGQTAKAQDAGAKSNARNAVSAMESCFTDAQTYATCDNATLTAGGMKAPAATGVSASDAAVTKGTVGVVGTPSATGYVLTARSQSNSIFKITSTNGVLSYSCSPVGGGCPTGGNWGQ